MVAIRASTVLLHHSEYQHPMEAGGIGNGLLQLKKKKHIHHSWRIWIL